MKQSDGLAGFRLDAGLCLGLWNGCSADRR